MVQGEDLLYTPVLHLMFVFKPVLKILVATPILLGIGSLIVQLLLFSVSSLDLEFFILPLRFTVVRFVLWTAGILSVFSLVWYAFLYQCTEYGVTNKRLLIKKGIISATSTDIPMDRIESIYCVQGIFGRLFNYGTILISGIGGTMPVFQMVSKPYALRRKIVEIVEKNKAITVIHGEAPVTEKPAEAKPQPPMEKEPLYRYGTFVRVLPNNQK
jgi:uncharacterized membrane protein YdbT with pleckstrin-like domain